MNSTSRREFLKTTAMALTVVPVAAGCRTVIFSQTGEGTVLDRVKRNAIKRDGEWNGAKDAPRSTGPRTNIRLSGDNEDRLVVSGTVYRSDAKTPVPNALIYFYHTDSKGIYGQQGEHRHGRYRGWLLTGSDGKFEFETIRPAPYPGRKFAAHIHMTVTTLDRPEDWIDSILFEGDELISANERRDAGKKGGFDPIIKLVRDEGGIWRGTRDISLPEEK